MLQQPKPDVSHHHGRWSRFHRVALLLGAAIAVACVSLPGDVAHAIVGCRSDPVLVVNGTIVDVVSTLGTPASTVRELDYIVTVPNGSVIGKTSLTVGIGFPEKVTYIYSSAQPLGTMSISAQVVTQTNLAPFATEVQASALLTSTAGSGTSAAPVTVWLAHLVML